MFPTGTVTLLFTDIQGSTQLLNRLGDEYASVLDAHREILRAAFSAHDGHEVDTQGDSFFAVFARAHDAVNAVAQAQRALHEYSWPEANAVRVRMSLHTGEPVATQSGYVGLDVHRGARLMSAAHGEQVLLSSTTRALVENDLPPGVSLRDLGEHRLKDLARAIAVSQLDIEGVPHRFPPLKTLDTHPHNLPQQPTPLLGREAEVEEACALLRRDDVRLLTLAGPGGTGKTRLGLQIAAELLHEYEGGAWFVDLAPLSEAATVTMTISKTLGVGDSLGMAALVDWLKPRPLLLLLDNFEHVLEAAPCVAQLLAQCPRLKVVVTSRTVLQLRGEREFDVSPLALPRRKPPPTLAQLSQFAAVQLFIQRAQAVRSNFVVTAENAPAIAEICARLDGLPLAIELAAARVKMLSPIALLARLEKSLNLLTGGARDSVVRQQTLRGAIEWSHDLLDDDERTLFRRLSVFAGGCTLDAIEAVCAHAAPHNGEQNDNAGGSVRSDLEGDVFDCVCSLVGKSLLRQSDGDDGEPRFWMLETIREYSCERLVAAGEDQALRRAHAAYFLRVSQAEVPYTMVPDASVRLQSQARVEAEIDNVRSALTWSMENDPNCAVRLIHASSCLGDGRVPEADANAERALEQPCDAPPDIVAAVSGIAIGHAEKRGDWRKQHTLAQRRLQAARAAGELRELAWALFYIGRASRNLGDFPSAGAYFGESVALFRELNQLQPVGWTLNQLGDNARERNDLEAARGFFEECLAIFQQSGDRDSVASSLSQLADILHAQGEMERAQKFFTETLAIERELGDERDHPWRRYQRGNFETSLGNEETVRALLRESLRGFAWLGDQIGALYVFLAMARLASRESKARGATVLLGAESARREKSGGPPLLNWQVERERILNQARASLAPAAFTAAWELGRALSLEDAINRAIRDRAIRDESPIEEARDAAQTSNAPSLPA